MNWWVCRIERFLTLNYKTFIILSLTVTGCISISGFASVVGMSIGITSSEMGSKIYVITSTIKKHKSTI